jgi:hypothetical protein
MRRHAVLTLLATLALTAPAHAGDPISRLVDKVADGPAATCRNLLGADFDAQCSANPRARRVVRAEIDSYQTSWVHRALRTQERLGDELPMGRATFPGTHNSFNRLHGVAADELPGVSELDNNQQLSLTDQLRLDMRSLELDVHWFPNAGTLGYAPVVCHAQGDHSGCSFERTLSTVLRKEIVPWLDAHKSEVVLLYLEDHLDSPTDAAQEAPAHAAAVATLKSVLGKRILRTTGRDFRTLTRDAARDAGAQVVLVGDQYPGDWNELVFDWRAGGFEVEYGPGEFTSGCSSAPFGTKFVRFFEDSTFLSAAVDPTGTAYDMTPAITRGLVACGINLFGFDQLVPGDERLPALVWSWAPGETAGGGCTIQRAGDGRWERGGCGRKLPAACRTASGSWVLAAPGNAKKADDGCADAGGTFATPRTYAENAALAALAGGQDVYLALDPR